MNIRGIEPYSLSDGHTGPATVIFLGGCNFRCNYCYNLDIVDNKHELIDINTVAKYIEEKKDWIKEVVISGGEPLLEDNNLYLLINIVKRINEDLKIHLYTNGYCFDRLKEINESIDIFSMDIKFPLDRYYEIVNVDIDEYILRSSIELLNSISYEKPVIFRTTVWKDFGLENIKKIRSYISGKCNYKIQNYLGKNLIPCDEKELVMYKKFEINKK